MVAAILAAGSTDTAIVVALISGGGALVLGLIQIVAQRGKNSSASAKDIAEASKVARADLVDEVSRLALVVDKQQAQIESLLANVRSLGDTLEQERARCTQLSRELDTERAYTTRLAAALTAAGLDVPVKGMP